MNYPELDALLCQPRRRDLSARAYNALTSAGLYTLKQVRGADLACVRNMGPKLQRFVQKRLAVALASEDADFVKVERWECRIGCGALLRAEDTASHDCRTPDVQGTDDDPVCANCGELRSTHSPPDFKVLPPVCRSTPFHLVHFRHAPAERPSSTETTTTEDALHQAVVAKGWTHTPESLIDAQLLSAQRDDSPSKTHSPSSVPTTGEPTDEEVERALVAFYDPSDEAKRRYGVEPDWDFSAEKRRTQDRIRLTAALADFLRARSGATPSGTTGGGGTENLTSAGRVDRSEASDA